MWQGWDDFRNLWPLERNYNEDAGRRQNQNQRITFRPNPLSPCAVNITIQVARQRFFADDRFYIITVIMPL